MMWLFFSSTKKMASTKKWLHKNVLADANTSWYLPHCISSKWQSMSVTIFNPIKDAYSIWSLKNMLKLAYDNYTWSFPVIISFIRTNTWNIRLFQKPVGNMTSTSFPETTVEIVSFGSNFTAQDILNSERHLSASSRGDLKLITSRSQFPIILFEWCPNDTFGLWLTAGA